MKTEQFKLNIVIDVNANITSDCSSRQKGVDARMGVARWIEQELNLPENHFLDISDGYGKLEIQARDNDYVNVELY
jgi:hypothetical protein